jgi:4-amino-4-deoxychorismate lyase
MLINGKPGNVISIRDRGLLYGDGVFRTLRVLSGRAHHWTLHYKKLQHDCNVLGIICPEECLLLNELNQLISLHPDCVLKLIVTRGEGTRGYAPPAQAKPGRYWDIGPLPDYPAEWTIQGIKVRLCQLCLSHQPLLAGIKHLNRLENVLAAAECNDAEIAEGILLDISGNVIEGTRSNLFIITNGEIITPNLATCGVAGVQRERVLEWATTFNMTSRVKQFGLTELLAADAVFLVNSVIGLWQVREFQARHWNPHPVTRQVQEWLNHEAD